MIRVRLELDAYGLLSSLETEGHAAVLTGAESVACAAVSALVRTAARLIEAREGVEHRGEAPSDGYLSIRVYRVPRRHRRWLLGVTDYLVAGVQDVERDYPDDCRVDIRVKE